MVDTPMTQEEKTRRGAEDAGKYFRYVTDFVGFTAQDALAIRESGLVIEKHLPQIVADFYSHLMRYPPTRKHFIKKDGTVDQDYLQKRMHHLTNFWRRTASGHYDDDYARYVDYVGRAHTMHGADPTIYIAERYVIGQVGFMQRAISQALTDELHEYDPDLENRAIRAWNLLMMVILEMLARAYTDEHELEPAGPLLAINETSMKDLAVHTYEAGLGLLRPVEKKEVRVAAETDIPDGERLLVEAEGISIGIFHHRGNWYAVRNHCLHRGGPVATGKLNGDVLTCPWHGYQYDVTTGSLLVDPAVKLETYPLELRDGEVVIRVPRKAEEQAFDFIIGEEKRLEQARPALPEGAFYLDKVPAGSVGLVQVGGQAVAVYNVEGEYYATSAACTHAGGPLNEGELKGSTIICPWHGSCFDVTSGAARCGPAESPVRPYRVAVEGDVGRVHPVD